MNWNNINAAIECSADAPGYWDRRIRFTGNPAADMLCLSQGSVLITITTKQFKEIYGIAEMAGVMEAITVPRLWHGSIPQLILDVPLPDTSERLKGAFLDGKTAALNAVRHLSVPINESSPDDLRNKGLMVAVHNDYRLNGKNYTFWLFTEASGMSYKGEGATDAEALNNIRKQLKELGK